MTSSALDDLIAFSTSNGISMLSSMIIRSKSPILAKLEKEFLPTLSLSATSTDRAERAIICFENDASSRLYDATSSTEIAVQDINAISKKNSSTVSVALTPFEKRFLVSISPPTNISLASISLSSIF